LHPTNYSVQQKQYKAADACYRRCQHTCCASQLADKGLPVLQFRHLGLQLFDLQAQLGSLESLSVFGRLTGLSKCDLTSLHEYGLASEAGGKYHQLRQTVDHGESLQLFEK
jgi:hypothetical protein